MDCSECPICMDVIENNNNCMVTECGHRFHTNCMLKHVSMGNHGCPMCRSTMVPPSENEDSDEDEDEDDAEYSDEDDDDSLCIDFESNDIRNDYQEYEDYLLRGFRWMFLQYPSEEDDFSMFDGNSMAITPNSMKRHTTQTEGEEDITEENDEEYEEDEESIESEWMDSEKKYKENLLKVEELENILKKRKVSYNDLLVTILTTFQEHVKDNYYNEMLCTNIKTLNTIKYGTNKDAETENYTPSMLMPRNLQYMQSRRMEEIRQRRRVDSPMTIDEVM